MPGLGSPNVKKLKAKRDVDGLLRALTDKSSDVRAAAVMALGELGDDRAVGPLVAAFDDPDAAVRAAAAAALGEIGGARVVDPLIAALGNRGETNWVVRARAATALGKIGGTRPVEPLIAALKYGDGAYCAAEALGEIGDPRAIQPLLDALGEGNTTLRQSAAEALAKFGDARAAEPLIAQLGDRYEVNRTSAADALGELGVPAVEPLIAALAAQPGVPPRTVAELRGLGDLSAAGREGDGSVRQVVVKAARELAAVLPVRKTEAVPERTAAEEGIVETARTADGPSITLRAADERMVGNLTSDPYFLAGVLIEDASSEARAFLVAMDEGSVVHEVSGDPAGAGFLVKLTIQTVAQEQSDGTACS